LLSNERLGNTLIDETPLFYTICHSLIAHFKSLDGSLGIYEYFENDSVNVDKPGFLANSSSRFEIKTTQVFTFLNVLLNCRPLQLDNRNAFIHLMSYLQSMAPHTRKVDTHVEFEGNVSGYARGIMIETRELRNEFCEMCEKLSGIRYIVELIERDKKSLETGDVEYNGIEQTVGVYCMKDKASLFTPLHWILAQLIRLALKSGDSKRVFSLLSRVDVKKVMSIVDSSLRSLVFSSQIHNGAWVLNGPLLATQALQYCYGTMRDFYDSDVFLLQVAASIASPDYFLITLISRFELLDWFTESGESDGSVIDLLRLVSFVLCERRQMCGDEKNEIEDEIVHHLAANEGGLVFTELVGMISPRLNTDTKVIESLLARVADLKIPRSIDDSGRYLLKAEFYQTVNPKFWHYSRKERQNIDLRKLHMNVQPLPALPLAFKNIAKITESLTFVRLLFISFFTAVGVEGGNQIIDEAILDQSFFLFDIAMRMGCDGFTHLVCNRSFVVPGTVRNRRTLLAFLLEFMSRDDIVIRSFVPRMEVIAAVYEVDNTKAEGLISEWRNALNLLSCKPTVVSDRKKRKAMLLKRFAEQQSLFSKQNISNEDASIDAVIEGTPLPSGNCVFCQDVCGTNSAIYGMISYVRSSATGLIGNGSASVCTTPCGHLLHNACFREFMDGLYIERNRGDDSVAGNFSMFVGYVSLLGLMHRTGEFLCPLCKSLSNCLIPVLWTSQKGGVFEAGRNVSEGFDEWMLANESTLKSQRRDIEKSPLVDCIRLKEPTEPDAKVLDFRRIRNGETDEETSDNLRNALASHRRFVSMAETAHHEIVGEEGMEGQGEEETLVVLLKMFASSVSYLVLVSAEESALGDTVRQISSQNMEMLRVLAENVLMAASDGRDERLVDLEDVGLDCFEKVCGFVLTGGGMEPARYIIYVMLVRIIIETIADKIELTVASKEGSGFFERVLLLLGTEVSACESSALLFLRKCMILIHARYGLSLDIDRSDKTAELLHYTTMLGIPTISDILSVKTMESSCLSRLISLWCKKPLSPSPIRLRDLTTLPPRHDQMNKSITCASCNAISTAFSQCMLCGTSIYRACTCKRLEPVAECLAHIKTCSGKTGMVILIDSSHVMLVHDDFYCVVNSPYLDRRGELDPGLRRGGELVLCEKRVREFRKIWMRMGVVELICQRIEDDLPVNHFRA
jgi:hypothetical protein